MAARTHLVEKEQSPGSENMSVHESAIISPGAALGKDVRIGPFCIIGPNVEIGDRVHLHENVSIDGYTTIGADTEIYPGAVVGKEPQILNFKTTPESRTEIGARTVIREHVTIHAGAPELCGLTHVGDDCFLMVGVHIAHDCFVADKCVFANQVTLGGSVHVEEEVWIGGLAAVKQNCRIGKHAFASGGAMIRNCVIPYGFVTGNFAQLVGLNVIGLKRRGFSRKTIHAMRGAYRLLFAKEGSFSERIEDTRTAYSNLSEVNDILDFIDKFNTAGLTLPE